jgi:hypothetical protein
MFGLGMEWVIVVAATALILEIVLCWASVALVDGPEVRLPKAALLGLLIAAVYLPAIFLVFYGLGLAQMNPFAGEVPWKPYAAIGVSLLIMLVVPFLFYLPLVPIGVRKGLWATFWQWLLRGFAAALIIGLVLVGYALKQIIRPNPGAQATIVPTQLQGKIFLSVYDS